MATCAPRLAVEEPSAAALEAGHGKAHEDDVGSAHCIDGGAGWECVRGVAMLREGGALELAPGADEDRGSETTLNLPKRFGYNLMTALACA